MSGDKESPIAAIAAAYEAVEGHDVHLIVLTTEQRDRLSTMGALFLCDTVSACDGSDGEQVTFLAHRAARLPEIANDLDQARKRLGKANREVSRAAVRHKDARLAALARDVLWGDE